jgi:hypothetical protein
VNASNREEFPSEKKRASFAENENPARACDVGGTKGGVSGTLIWLGEPGNARGLRFANSRDAPKVPHGTSCSLLTRHHAQAPAVLDHSRTLPQCDGQSGRVIRQKREPRPARGKGGVSGALIVSTVRSAKITSDFGALNEGSTSATHQARQVPCGSCAGIMTFAADHIGGASSRRDLGLPCAPLGPRST